MSASIGTSLTSQMLALSLEPLKTLKLLDTEGVVDLEPLSPASTESAAAVGKDRFSADVHAALPRPVTPKRVKPPLLASQSATNLLQDRKEYKGMGLSHITNVRSSMFVASKDPLVLAKLQDRRDRGSEILAETPFQSPFGSPYISPEPSPRATRSSDVTPVQTPRAKPAPSGSVAMGPSSVITSLPADMKPLKELDCSSSVITSLPADMKPLEKLDCSPATTYEFPKVTFTKSELLKYLEGKL